MRVSCRALSKSEAALPEREISADLVATLELFIGVPPLRCVRAGPTFSLGVSIAPTPVGGPPMTWKTPKIVEVPVGMEINMYACAVRK